MFRTTSALAISALLAVGAVAQTTDQATDATEQTGNAMMKAGDAADAAAENAEVAAENAGEAVENAADAAAEAGDAAMEKAGDMAEDAGAAATEATGDAVEATGEAVENAGEAMRDAASDAEPVETTTTTEGDAAVTVTEGDAAPVEGQPVEGQIFEQSADSFLGSTLLGATVQTPDGESVGDVEEIIVKADGSLEGVVIGVGGFLGLGEKEVAVEFGAIDIQQDAETGELTFILSSTGEELEAAPEFRTQDDIRAEAAAAEPVVPEGGIADPNAAPAAEAPADTTTAN